jgi:hypothetical protein
VQKSVGKLRASIFWNQDGILPVIIGMVTVVCRPGRGASQVETSPRLNWATQFLTVTYNGACSTNVSLRMA